jgi:hypothetical protein
MERNNLMPSAKNPGGSTQSIGNKGDNRSSTDRDGNRGAGKTQPGSIPDSDPDDNPSVGQDDANKHNRDRGDGTRRDSSEGGVS